MTEPVFSRHNGIACAPYTIEVAYDSSLDQYKISLLILDKKFSRMEKTRNRAVEYAKRIDTNLEMAFLYMWEDTSDEQIRNN